jgi:hypothetical protein
MDAHRRHTGPLAAAVKLSMAAATLFVALLPALIR